MSREEMAARLWSARYRIEPALLNPNHPEAAFWLRAADAALAYAAERERAAVERCVSCLDADADRTLTAWKAHEAAGREVPAAQCASAYNATRMHAARIAALAPPPPTTG